MPVPPSTYSNLPPMEAAIRQQPVGAGVVAEVGRGCLHRPQVGSPSISRSQPSKISCSTAHSSTTKLVTSTTTPSPPSTNPCAAPTPTPHCTGSHACSKPEKTLYTSYAVSSASPLKTWAGPIRSPCSYALLPSKPYISLASPKQTSHSHRPSFTWQL